MPTPPRPLRLAVTNVTLGNGGDAAILYGVERALRAALPPFEMTVFGTQPEVMAPYYPDLTVVAGLSSVAWPQIARGIPARARRAARWFTRSARLRAAARAEAAGKRALAHALAGADGVEPFRALADADLVVSSGGTYWVPAYWLGPRLLEFDVLHALGKPYALYTQSIGPLSDDMPVGKLARIFRTARVILLRDARSKVEVAAVAAGAHTSVRADAAFALADAETLTAAQSREWPESPTVAVSVRDWPHFVTGDSDDGMERYRRSVAATVTELVRTHGATVRFLSTCQGTPGYRYDDSATALAVVAHLPEDVRERVEVDRGQYSPLGVLEAYRACDLVIATRMHAAILALCAGTPVLPIAYQFKTEELFSAYGLGHWVEHIETTSPEGMVARLDRVLKELPGARAGLFEGVERMRADAMAAGALVAQAMADEIAAARR
ncbi:polysaccharide pyruvyl transferase family protein [Rubrivirga sp. IMCC45206]|uniref:polysaccharide pyruvyl transferase family protein n=1 Tax=Rubrivirga sp. IMCC45206 TaxID=3391614 RepID=UPI003990107E